MSSVWGWRSWLVSFLSPRSSLFRSSTWLCGSCRTSLAYPALLRVFSLIGRYIINDPFELVPSPISALLGVLVGGGFLLALAWGYEAFTGVEGMGGGDIKLLAMIGAFLGWPSIPVTLFFSSLGGSVIGLTAMLIKGVGRRYALPFAPFLCLGALFYLFFGKELIQLYISPG